MQKRSPAKVYMYGLLTLGLYNLVWLAKTRKELVAATSMRLPSMFWPVMAAVLGWVMAVTIAATALPEVLHSYAYVAPKQHGPTVSQACSAEWTLSQAPETSTTHQLSAKCRDEIQRAQETPKIQFVGFSARTTKILLAVLVPTALAGWMYVRWLVRYVEAVERVTNGRVNQNSAMLLLYGTSYGTAMVQSAFNNPNEVPAWMGTFHPRQLRQWLRFSDKVENGPIKHVLQTVAIVLAIFLVLLLLFPWAVSHIG